MTDDQNRVDLRWMPRTRRLLGDHGVTFPRAVSPDPLCCPARAEMLTGQLGQNNGVRGNHGPHGGFHGLLARRNTLAGWLQTAGYRTALVGKYLNRYHRQAGVQAGWTIWNPIVGGLYSYLSTTFFQDPVTDHTNVTRAISRYTVRYIHRFAARRGPFFLWVSHVAPHARVVDGRWAAPLPTRGHRDALSGVSSPSLRKPSFNRLGAPPWPYPELARLDQSRAGMQDKFTGRLQSLLDLDDAVARAVVALRETGQLANTYIFFVSDNGNLLGEHRGTCKDVLYREALEVPLVVRTPGAHRARTSPLPVTLTDIAPTIATLAGATPRRLQDGRSFAHVLAGARMHHWRDTQLIQTGGTSGHWSFRGVLTSRYTYLFRVRDRATFLYDHRTDPYELHNLARSSADHRIRVILHRRMVLLENCAGAECNQTFGPLPRRR